MKRSLGIGIAAIVTGGILCAQSRSPSDTLRLWRSADLDATVGELRDKIPGSGQNFALKDLDAFGKDRVRFYHLTGNGNSEMREKKVVVYIVRDGEATILNGGTLLNPTPRADDPRSWRGTGIEGAHSYVVKAGDVFKFPAGEAHQIQVAPGHSLTAVGLVLDVE